MAFSAERDVMLVIERLLSELWEACLEMKIETPFETMTYQKAMASYGSDKPDLRLGSEVCIRLIFI